MEKKRNNKKIFLYVFYVALTVAILIFVLSMNDLGKIGEALKKVNINYVLLAFALLLIYIILYPIPLCILSKKKKICAKTFDVYMIGMTEHFFNGITPFSTGGQPFQAYALAKKKVKVADSTGLLIMNFVIFMMVTNIYALISLIYFDKFITNSTMLIIAIIGFVMNFLVLLFMIALGTSRHLKNGLVALMRLLAKIKFLKKLLEPKIPTFTEYAENMQKAFKELWKAKGAFILCFLIKAVTMFAYYAITFFVIRAIGVDIGAEHIFFVVCGSAFAITMVVFLPTPGSSGGIEYAFSSILIAIGVSSSAVSSAGMLIWRLLTYYITILISFLFYVLFEVKHNVGLKKSKKFEKTACEVSEGNGEVIKTVNTTFTETINSDNKKDENR